MRLSWSVVILLLVAAAVSIDAARFRSIRVRYSSYRYSSYRSSRSMYMGPIYGRRLSPSVMGPMYFGYSSRYPMHFSYRSGSMSGTDVCTNNLALENGSHVGVFSCPFLADEPKQWTKCCGYEAEEFCCDPSYNDSWKNATGLSVMVILLIIGGCLLAVGLAIGLLVFCCIKKKRGGLATPFRNGNAASVNTQGQGKPFVDPAGKQVDGSNPVPPPYPTMEYGTIQPQAAPGPDTRGFSSAPYPPQQPQPPPYRSD